MITASRTADGSISDGDPAHDRTHLWRVQKLCESLGAELGARNEILLPAALLHDLVNLPKNHPDRSNASVLAAAEAASILRASGYKDGEIEIIQTVIKEHSYSAGHRPTSLESAILQDADRLDALGAIGIMRTVTCGAKFGCAYYDLDDPFATARRLDDQRFTLDHFFRKLFKLAELMNTEPGRREARLRTAFMRRFVDQLATEIN